MQRSIRKRRRKTTEPEQLETRSLLTTFTVTSLADEVADDGETTLREAIELASDEPGADTIVFEDGLSGTISLELGQLMISSHSVSIIGNGRDDTIIDAGGDSDIFVHYGGDASSLILQSMSLRNAEYQALYHLSGLYGTTGQITLDDVVVTGSQAGIALLFSNESFDGNARPEVTITNSSISGNDGFAIDFEGGIDATVVDSVVSGNAGTGVRVRGYGEESGTPSVTVSRTVVSENQRSGISRLTGSLTISDSFISGNSDPNSGGGVSGNNITIERTTISNNTSGQGGGVWGSGTIRNSTISGNTATNGGGLSGSFDVWNSTIVTNTATESGGGVATSSNVTLESNIIADNTAPASPDVEFRDNDTDPTFNHNLLGNNASTDFDATGASNPDADGNLIGSPADPIDPLLTELQDTGLFPVHVLRDGSPATDQGSNPQALATDQTGGSREEGGGVDIGAVEGGVSVFSVVDRSVTEGVTGTQNVVFTVTLLEDTGSFTVDASTADGTATLDGDDYIEVTRTLSFTGTAGESRDFTVEVNGDLVVEEDETFRIVFSNISDSSIPAPADGIGTIADDDTGADIRVEDGELIVIGTGEADTIEFDLEGDRILIDRNGANYEVRERDIGLIYVEAGGGDDDVIARLVQTPMLIDAGSGNDTVKSGLGDDTIIGGSGNDSLRGTQGDDLIDGLDGDDKLQGQVGNDTLLGGDGDDTLQGADDDDVLNGENGGDQIEGGPGRDHLIGMSGNDNLVGGGDRDTLEGGSGNDRLGGGGGRDRAEGGTGDDSLIGGNGTDTLLGQSGNDTLDAGAGADKLEGGSQADTLLGGGGDDVLIGGTGADLLEAGNGKDVLVGGYGSDTLFGGDGEDILVSDTFDPADAFTEIQHLNRLRNEWRSERTYLQRVENIRDSDDATDDRKNTTFLIGADRTGQNTFRDQNRDQVTGGAGLDLFFASMSMDEFDQAADELVEAL